MNGRRATASASFVLAEIPFLATLLLATPAMAQEATISARIVDLFGTRCAEIAADPEAAVAQSFDPNRAPGTVSQIGEITTDRSLLFYLEDIKNDAFGLTEYDYATLSFNREKLPGGTSSTCMLQYTFGGKDGISSLEETEQVLSDLPAVIEARISEVWGGPATRVGGSTRESSGAHRRFVWVYGDSFPPSRQLSLGQAGNAIILISTTTEAAQN